MGTEYGIDKKDHDLIAKFIERHAIPCYTIKKLEEEPTALDSSIGGIPYLPVGETLPNEKLVLQINFEGFELEGYPNKGVFQLYAHEDSLDIMDDDDGEYDKISEESYFEYEGECGAIGRYYADISDYYQKDIEPSKHRLNGRERKANKLLLEKTWSVPHSLPESDCESETSLEGDELKKMKESQSILDSFYGVITELFPNVSNIGGYSVTPQGISDEPKETLLFLSHDLIDWGDGGAFTFTYKDITSMEKDEEIESYGDMS